MSLVSGRGIQLAFGGDPIFDGLDFTIKPGERLCILGRNGAGKSTFFKLLMRQLHCDQGEINFQNHIKIALMDQNVPQSKDETCYEIIGSGVAENIALLKQQQTLLAELENDPSNAQLLDNLAHVQQEIESQNLWEVDHKIQKAASLLKIDPNEKFSALSGGRKRRAWLARALVDEPDILLLDEPTNHIDLETVLWLEEFLLSWQGTLVFISHDRSFISKLSTRIIDIDRGVASSWPGDYSKYLVGKQEALELETKQNKLFDKKLAQEETWIRQGIKARRTRNEGRVRDLIELRNQRKARREQQGQASFAISTTEKSSKIVIEAKSLSFAFSLANTSSSESMESSGKLEKSEHTILNNFSTLISRGDKIGIIGPNGIGKSTLIKLLLGQLESQQGSLKVADNLQIAYFDQLRETLDLDKNIIDNVAEGSDFIELGDKRTHIISYLKDFLFSSHRLRTPLSALSGGERNRVLLAKLFSKPSNFIVLDEPTNDLDIDTLELLEEKLLNFSGTLLLISHDRSFLNNIVTSTLVFESNGVNEYVGGYDDWLLQRPTSTSYLKQKNSHDVKTNISTDINAGTKKENSKKPSKRNIKLNFKDKYELESLPSKIESLESEQADINEHLSNPDNYRQSIEMLEGVDDKSTDNLIAALATRLKEIDSELEIAYQRWDELDS